LGQGWAIQQLGGKNETVLTIVKGDEVLLKGSVMSGIFVKKGEQKKVWGGRETRSYETS